MSSSTIAKSTEWAQEGCSLRHWISRLTRIDWLTVIGERDLIDIPMATRLSWGANRKTSKSEDRAYSLLGICAVNMPILYGEGGQKAFLRLQEEIVKDNADMSIFAWSRRQV